MNKEEAGFTLLGKTSSRILSKMKYPDGNTTAWKGLDLMEDMQRDALLFTLIFRPIVFETFLPGKLNVLFLFL